MKASEQMSAPEKRVLLFAPYFLPRRRVGAMRPFRFAIHLRKFGWQPTVLTIAAEGQHLTEKEARLLRGIEVIELDPPFDRSTSAESQLGTSSDSSSAVLEKLAEPLGSVLDAVDRQFPVDTWLPFFLLKYRALTSAVRRVRPHVLWSTGDPWSGLLAARHLAHRFQLPWVADFRDPWTLSPVRMNGQSALTKTLNRWCERRILHSANAVVFTSAQTEATYRRHYADLDLHTTTIYNSFDHTLFDDPVAPEASDVSDEPTSASHLDIGFFGRFRILSPATPIADALAAAHRQSEAAARIRVFSFGPLNAADERHARALGVRDQFYERDAVPLQKALSALRQFDLLLLSTDPRRDAIVPAKLWEYLAARRPILSLSKNPEITDLLERTGAGVQRTPENKHDIAELLLECLRAKQEGRALPLPFAPDPAAIERFEARSATQALTSLLNSVADTTGTRT